MLQSSTSTSRARTTLVAVTFFICHAQLAMAELVAGDPFVRPFFVLPFTLGQSSDVDCVHVYIVDRSCKMYAESLETSMRYTPMCDQYIGHNNTACVRARFCTHSKTNNNGTSLVATAVAIGCERNLAVGPQVTTETVFARAVTQSVSMRKWHLGTKGEVVSSTMVVRSNKCDELIVDVTISNNGAGDVWMHLVGSTGSHASIQTSEGTHVHSMLVPRTCNTWFEKWSAILTSSEGYVTTWENLPELEHTHDNCDVGTCFSVTGKVMEQHQTFRWKRVSMTWIAAMWMIFLAMSELAILNGLTNNNKTLVMLACGALIPVTASTVLSINFSLFCAASIAASVTPLAATSSFWVCRFCLEPTSRFKSPNRHSIVNCAHASAFSFAIVIFSLISALRMEIIEK